MLLKKFDKESRLYRSSENILDNSFGSSPRLNDDDKDLLMNRRRSHSSAKVDSDPLYDVIESLNLGDESSRRQQSRQQQPEEETSYISSTGDHLASDRSRGRGGGLENGDLLFHATPREIESPNFFDHQKRDLPAPPPIPAAALQLVENHFIRNGSSRASSHRSSCASDEMVVAPTSTAAGDTSSRRNSSKIPFSTPEYHQMSPSSQGSGGIAHQSPTASAILPLPPNSSSRNQFGLGSPGSELVSLNQFLTECNNTTRNSDDGDLDETNEGTPETRRRASSVANEGYSSDFKQDSTKGLSYYRYALITRNY